MITFPNCKINLGLNILGKRDDGFHDLETVFYPVHLNDVLEIIPARDNKTELTVTGLRVGRDSENICMKAFDLIKNEYSSLPGIKMHLHKVIPSGAGLGGGSADAAFCLQLLNNIFHLNIPDKKIFGYALQLGSDCPFFLLNKPCIATGRGEKIEQITISLSAYKILLIYPSIKISTRDAFKEITPVVRTKKIREIIQQPIETWKDELQNDFEEYAFSKYTILKKIKGELYADGALYASMSGSGSTVFGIFKKEHVISYSEKPNYFYKLFDLD